MTPSCDQLWRVEAALDARLDARARHTFDAHLLRCSVCRAERAALLHLKHELRQIARDVDETSLRLLRERTLEAAARGPRSVARKPLLTGAAAFAACALVLLWPRAPSSIEHPAHHAVVVTPEHGAQWQRNLEQGVERIALSSGTLMFRVARRPSDPRLVVSVPDGEIEDLGTVFSVSVQHGQTVEIKVDEGRVLFHRTGMPELPLVAGSTFHPVHEEAVPEHGLQEQAPETQRADTPRPVRGARSAKAPQHAAAPAVAAQDDSEQTRREDAAYLLVLEQLRRGNADEARSAARDYLRSYPNGFRRPEVNRLLEAK